jgi:hypothetical protein
MRWRRMARLDSLRHRLRELESGLGLVELADGTLFKPDSGLDLMLTHMRLTRNLGRDAQLSDFSPGDQELLRNYAKWTPDRAKWGQVSILITDLARKLCE